MPTPQNQTRRVPAWTKTFLRELEKGRPIDTACKLSGAGRERVIQQKRKDPEFAERMNAAHEKGRNKKGVQF